MGDDQLLDLPDSHRVTCLFFLARYHQEIGSKVPVRSLCEILRMGIREYSVQTTERTSIASSPFRPSRPARTTSTTSVMSTPGPKPIISHACSPRWLHRVVNILRLRRHNSSRAEMVDFAACGGVDTLVKILSSHNIVRDLSLFVIAAEEDEDGEEKASVGSSVHDDMTEPVTSPSSRATNPTLPTVDIPVFSPVDARAPPLLKRLSLTRRVPATIAQQTASTLSTSDIERKQAYAIQQKLKETSQLEVINDIGQFVVTNLQIGSAVLVDTSVLLFSLIHESNVCAQHIASQPTLVEQLVRSLWLLSSHGPFAPRQVDVALQNVLLTTLRVVHSLPESVYATVLLSTPIIPVVVATGISPSGDGVMTPAAVELLSDIVVGVREETAIPVRPCAPTRCPSDVSLRSSDEGIAPEDSPTPSSRRLSLRQVVITEGSAELSVDPLGASIENADAARVLMSRSKRSVRSKLAPLASVIDVVSRTIPLQLARLCFELMPVAFCSHVFNNDVQAPNAIWNATLRRDLVIGLYQDLAEWHYESFDVTITTPSCADKMLTEEQHFSRYATLHCEAQLSGVLIRYLISMQSSKDIIGPFDVRIFATDIMHAVQGSLSEFRVTRSDSVLKKKTSSNDAAAWLSINAAGVQSGPNEALQGITPEKRIGFLFLGLGKIVEHFAFPEDVWFNDVLPVICHVLESFCGVMEKGMVSPTAALPWDLACELSVEVCANGIIVVVQSLTAAGFVQDDSMQQAQTQAKTFTKSLRKFRVDEMGMKGPLALFKECQRALVRTLRLCSICLDEGKFPTSAELSCSLNVLLSSVNILLLQLSSQLLDLTPIQVEETRSGSNVSLKIAEESPSTSSAHTPSVEVLKCLRVLKEEGIYRDLVRCVRFSVVTASPVASLGAMTSLRLLLTQAGEASPELIHILLENGLPVFVLHTMMELLSEDLEVFTSLDKPWITHTALPVSDKFTEKVQAPPNRRRSVAGVSDEEQRKSIETAQAMVPVRSDSDSHIPLTLCEMCRHVMTTNQKAMVHLMSSQLSDSCHAQDESGSVQPDTIKSKVTASEGRDGCDTPLSKRQLIYECVLLIRTLVFTANEFDRKTDSSVATPSTTSHETGSLAVAGQAPVANVTAAKTKAPAVVEFLEQILTPSLLHVLLYNFSAFTEIFRATKPTKRPLVIWNAQMKSHLNSFLMKEIEKIRVQEQNTDSPPTYDIHSCIEKEGFKSFFPFLAEEVVVDGVYVKLLLDPQHRDDIGARDLPSFVELLQASVSSSQRVLELLTKSRRQSTTGKTNIVAQVSVKQQVLDHIIRQHPELGYSDLYVMDDQTY